MLCLAALAVVCISAINHKKTSVVDAVDVKINKFDEGEYFLTEDDVRKEIDEILGEEEGLLMTEVHVARIEEALHSNPFIADVDVFLSSDQVLGVSVVQKQPLERIFDDRGKTYYMDREGMMIPVSEYFTARVPVITGYVRPDNAEADETGAETEWTKLYQLVTTVEGDPFMNAMIEQFDVSKQNKVSMVPKVGDTKIVFGRIEDVDAKLNNLKAFYKDVIAVYGWDLYETIDLTIVDQVVVKKKPNHN